LRRERELFVEMWQSTEAAARSYYFSAERETAKVPGVPPDTPAIPVKAIGVIAAGAWGAGIAQSSLNAGLPVTIFDVRRDALSALELAALKRADLVIEAGDVTSTERRDLFGRLDRICRPDALIALSSAFLDLDELAAANSRPARVLGLHFFAAPQNARLIEVVRGRSTSGETIATVMKFVKTIGRVAVLCRVGHDLVADRVMSALGGPIEDLLTEGLRPEDVDQAIYDFGFPTGPFQMTDSAGHALLEPARRMVVAGDGLRQRRPSAEDIVARVLYPAVNEGAKLLEAGIALRASDIDVACVLGYGWPVYTGGPMFWGDTLGLPTIVARLEGFELQHGARFKPAALLKQLASEGRKFINR
jgi:3-hydroxyacyl-CoA dehydrogenase